MPRKSLYALITHLAGWLLMMSLPLIFMSSSPGSEDILSIVVSYEYWFFVLPFVVIFYLHTRNLFPKLYLAKKHLGYNDCIVGSNGRLWTIY